MRGVLCADGINKTPDVFEGRFARLDLPDEGPWTLEWRAWHGDERIDLARASATVRLDDGAGREVLHPEFPLAAYQRGLQERRERGSESDDR